MCVAVPNFIKIGRTVAEIWRFNGFIKMAAVRHLGFVGRLLGPPTMTNWWCLTLCQIRLKSMEWFRQHETVNILPVWLENFYSRSKIGVFGGLSPNMGCSINETPKGTFLRESASFEPLSVNIRRRV